MNKNEKVFRNIVSELMNEKKQNDTFKKKR